MVKRNRITIHIIFWIAYVLFKSYLNFETGPFSKDGMTQLDVFLLVVFTQSLFLPVKIPLVYLLFYIIDQYLLKSWSIAKSTLAVIVLFSISILCYNLINHIIILNGLYDMHVEFNKGLLAGSIIYSFFILCFTCGIAITLKLIRLNIKQKEDAQELMKKKLESELNLLKSQINPHFLFNTLNNIYALAIKKSEDTAPVVIKLSKLLRFMLYESSKDQILISEEIKLIEDFIELEKIRYNDRLSLKFSVSTTALTAKITPLLLLPLIENAFKHGASSSTDDVFIHIDIKEDNGQLFFTIENSKQSNEDVVVIENMGLKNVRRQLELTYGEFKLTINNQPNLFQVILYIDLSSYGKI